MLPLRPRWRSRIATVAICNRWTSHGRTDASAHTGVQRIRRPSRAPPSRRQQVLFHVREAVTTAALAPCGRRWPVPPGASYPFRVREGCSQNQCCGEHSRCELGRDRLRLVSTSHVVATHPWPVRGKHHALGVKRPSAASAMVRRSPSGGRPPPVPIPACRHRGSKICAWTAIPQTPRPIALAGPVLSSRHARFGGRPGNEWGQLHNAAS